MPVADPGQQIESRRAASPKTVIWPWVSAWMASSSSALRPACWFAAAGAEYSDRGGRSAWALWALFPSICSGGKFGETAAGLGEQRADCASLDLHDRGDLVLLEAAEVEQPHRFTLARRELPHGLSYGRARVIAVPRVNPHGALLIWRFLPEEFPGAFLQRVDREAPGDRVQPRLQVRVVADIRPPPHQDQERVLGDVFGQAAAVLQQPPQVPDQVRAQFPVQRIKPWTEVFPGLRLGLSLLHQNLS